MKVIHAYRRKEATTVELFGLFIEFKPNDKKDVVAEVDHEEAVDRLLSIREAYRLYPGQPAAAVQSAQSSLVNQQATAQVLTDYSTSKIVMEPANGYLSIQKDAGEAAKPGDAGASVATQQTSDSGKSGKSEQDPGANQNQESGESQSPYVFANEAGETIDISEWTAAQIRTFAESNEITLPKGNSVKVGELRDLLAAALRADSKE
ncbi:hypothetical protein KV708_09600 [Comamonas thiooxydans]|uniref:hypothetical protein n=1 Tax=Comamonas thiooxydans TaxID=363952 RepID=UPI00070DA743|nr:hypothetical protein [Comamonas thiooxydans]